MWREVSHGLTTDVIVVCTPAVLCTQAYVARVRNVMIYTPLTDSMESVRAWKYTGPVASHVRGCHTTRSLKRVGFLRDAVESAHLNAGDARISQ